MSTTTFLLAFSDDLFLHGHHLSRWITDYVDIEESLAVGSMAQEDLAHSASLMSSSGIGLDTRNWRIFERPPAQWSPSLMSHAPSHVWSDTAARGLLTTLGFEVLLEQLDPREDPDAGSLTVMRAEQALHRRHWERWLRIISTDPESARDLDSSLSRMAGSGADLFGDVPGDQQPDGAQPVEPFGPLDLDEAHRLWVERVDGVLDAFDRDIEMPRHRVDRAPGDRSAPLVETLDSIRAVRRSHPDRVYPAHG